MDQLVSFAVLLLVFSCAFSAFFNHDALLPLRTLLKKGSGLITGTFVGFIRGSYKLLKKWTSSTWKVATNSRKPPWIRIAAGITTSLLAASVAILFLPGELVGKKGK